MQGCQWQAGDAYPVQPSLLKSAEIELACKAGPVSLHRCAEQLAAATGAGVCLPLSVVVQGQVSDAHSMTVHDIS